jgi:glycerol-3-phosphate acyltransferase PlsY
MARSLAVLVAYLAGSIPTAYLVGTANGVDLRTVGSGNLGATNVQRALGWRWGLFVYVVDFCKGWLPVLLLPRAFGIESGWPWGVVIGIAAILGHVRPVFLLGKGGGKGVATASGVFMALAPAATLGAIGGFLVIVLTTRYVSLGSIVGALMLASILLVREQAFTPLVIVAWAIAAFVLYTHRDNIRRLRRGEERRIGGPKKAGGSA